MQAFVSMKRTLIVDGISFFFFLLFLYTATAKLFAWHTFREELQSSPLIGNSAWFVVWALPVAEIILCVALVAPFKKPYGLYATFVLMILFTVYIAGILLVDNQLSCSCGGIIENLSPDRHIVFNIICVFLSGLAILIYRKQAPTPRFQWLTGAFSIIFLFLLVWILFSAYIAKAATKTGMEGRVLPSFEILVPDSSTLNTAEIPTGSSFVMIGFSPSCTHCQAEIRNIIQDMPRWKDTHVYLVTTHPFLEVKEFYRNFKLAQYTNITIGRDLNNAFFSYFKTLFIPYTAVYDPKKRLKQVFIGGVTSAELRKTIEN
jgi:hypothetical protein